MQTGCHDILAKKCRVRMTRKQACFGGVPNNFRAQLPIESSSLIMIATHQIHMSVDMFSPVFKLHCKTTMFREYKSEIYLISVYALIYSLRSI